MYQYNGKNYYIALTQFNNTQFKSFQNMASFVFIIASIKVDKKNEDIVLMHYFFGLLCLTVLTVLLLTVVNISD